MDAPLWGAVGIGIGAPQPAAGWGAPPGNRHPER